MSNQLFVYGAGGHGKVLASLARITGGYAEIYFIDDNPRSPKVNGFDVVHSCEVKFSEDLHMILGVGNNLTRYGLVRKLQANYVTLIHPNATVCEFAAIGLGSAVMASAVVNTDAIIGNHCIINSGAIVEHDCRLADFVHLSPNAALSGGVMVDEGAHIGLGACVIQGVKIGKWATVGAGAVIIKDVPDYAVVVGNPGKTIKFNEVNLQ